MRGPIRTAILISGSGSNMEALVKSTLEDEAHPARVDLVISNRPDVGGLAKAEALGIKTLIIDHKNFKTRKSFEAAVDKALHKADIELIACAGFMRILTPWFVSRWNGKILNIHPSLLPKYKGLNTHQRAIEAGDTYHGASVHWVTEELDGGDVIAQSKVKIDKTDTIPSLAAKVLDTEHPLYCKSLKLVASQMRAPV